QTDAGWVIARAPGPLPPYRLPRVIRSSDVVVVEGEKCADVAESLGLVATTAAGGASAAHHTDWSALAGKNVSLLPDNDDAGRRHMESVLRILAALSPAPKVSTVVLPDLGPGGDIADYVATRTAAGESLEAIAQQIRTLLEAAHREDAT